MLNYKWSYDFPKEFFDVMIILEIILLQCWLRILIIV